MFIEARALRGADAGRGQLCMAMACVAVTTTPSAAQRLQLSQSRLCGRRRDGAAGGLGRGSTSRARGRLCWERLLCCRGLSLCCREPHAPESQGLLDALLEVALAGLDRLHLRAQPCMAKPGAVAKGSQAHR